VPGDHRGVHISSRAARRASVVAALSAGVFAVAVPSAGAHVEIRAPEGTQAGTGPVTLTFIAEAESTTAGIVAVQSQLPAGIAPEEVTLAGGPAGWTLTPTPDGFDLGGPDIGTGVDVEFGVTVARVPADATELVFPTMQRYADGRQDAWIEPVTDALPDPDMPAPVVTVAPGAAGGDGCAHHPGRRGPGHGVGQREPVRAARVGESIDRGVAHRDRRARRRRAGGRGDRRRRLDVVAPPHPVARSGAMHAAPRRAGTGQERSVYVLP
jgi:hypothetical protein